MECPYCGGRKFYEGPSGGLSTNILCANENCRHWFNYLGPMDKLEDLHRVEPSDAEKAEEQKRIREEQQAKPTRDFEQGRKACAEGSSLVELFESAPRWHAVTGSDLWILAGYIEELRSMIKKN